MPNHNGFHGHIVWVNHGSKGATRSRKNHIAEFCEQVSKDRKTVTCYIAAETGRFFAGTWWCNDNNPHTAQSYTAEFIRDGESVHRAGFGREVSAKVQGIAGEWMNPETNGEDDEDDEDRRYYFMFRGIEVTGEDEHTTVVPDDIGKLEIVIRKATDDELAGGDDNNEDGVDDGDDEDNSAKDSVSDGESDKLSGRDHDHINNDDNSDFEDLVSGIETDNSDDETYDPNRLGEHLTNVKKVKKRPQRMKRARARKSPPKDLNDTFTDWREKKPRHTHTAAMTRCDGRLWQDRQRCHVPTLRTPLDDNEEDIIVRFVFIYTSMEHIETHLKDSNVKAEPHVSPSSSHNPIRRSDSEHPPVDLKPARKRRRLEPALAVKTEDQKRMFDEWLAYQEQANSMKRALEASMRARGDAVEGDEGNPIKVED